MSSSGIWHLAINTNMRCPPECVCVSSTNQWLNSCSGIDSKCRIKKNELKQIDVDSFIWSIFLSHEIIRRNWQQMYVDLDKFDCWKGKQCVKNGNLRFFFVLNWIENEWRDNSALAADIRPQFVVYEIPILADSRLGDANLHLWMKDSQKTPEN